MNQQTFYHISNGRDLGFELHEGASVRWRQYFCHACGLRLPSVDSVDIQIDKNTIPPKYVMGFFGLQDIGFAHRDFLNALDLPLQKYFRFGSVRGKSGGEIPDWKTFCGKGPRVPVRGHGRLLADRCVLCQRIRFAAFGDNRYVVMRGPMREPIYESTDCQFVLREDVFHKIKPHLTKYVRAERLRFETTGQDERTEPELEWHGDPPKD